MPFAFIFIGCWSSMNTRYGPASRTEAERIIHAEIQSVITRNKGRVLLCADFGYGYPTGFASLLPHSCFAELPAWRIAGNICASTFRMTPEQNPASNRTITAIASQSPTRSTPKYRVPLREVRSGVSSSLGKILAFHKTNPDSRSSPVAHRSPRFESLTEERKVILRSVYLAPAASAARSSPAFRASKISASLHRTLDAPPFGLSKPDGLRRSEPGSIRSSESSTPKSIRASERHFRTRSRIVARCARCGTGRAISTQQTRSARNSQYLRA
jgi:hypothetical protein